MNHCICLFIEIQIQIQTGVLCWRLKPKPEHEHVRLLLEHFRAVVDYDKFYSLPADLLQTLCPQALRLVFKMWLCMKPFLVVLEPGGSMGT